MDKELKTTYKSFAYSISNSIMTIELNRDKEFNSLNWQLVYDIYDIFTSLNDPSCEDIRAVVMFSTGKHFSSGLDLKQTAAELFSLIKDDSLDSARVAYKLRYFIRRMQKATQAIEKCKVPVITVVNGFCIGGAIDIISACDIIISTNDTIFSIREVKVGLAADLGTLNRLSISNSNFSLLKELALTGRFFGPEEASKIGLVYNCYENKNIALDKAKGIAKEIAMNSPIAVYGTKKGLNMFRNKEVSKGLKTFVDHNAAFLQTDDLMTSVQAIMTKTEPKFPKL